MLINLLLTLFGVKVIQHETSATVDLTVLNRHAPNIAETLMHKLETNYKQQGKTVNIIHKHEGNIR